VIMMGSNANVGGIMITTKLGRVAGRIKITGETVQILFYANSKQRVYARELRELVSLYLRERGFVLGAPFYQRNFRAIRPKEKKSFTMTK
jgi:hypothetical protein